MKKHGFKYIYGPVSSWRLGRSLGVDLLYKEKTCNFNCIYCQLGKTGRYRSRRGIFVPLNSLKKELRRVPHHGIDIITFSGLGESTLAGNLGRAIRLVRHMRREPIAVLTNASFMSRRGVRRELALADLVVAKLDAPDEKLFKNINRPALVIRWQKVLGGIKCFALEYPGKLALQVMFIKENKKVARKLAALAREIAPVEIQLNTPLRPCPIKPLSKREMVRIKKEFRGLPVVSVYEAKPRRAIPISTSETLKRRGKPY